MTSNQKSLNLDIDVLNKHQWVDAKQFDNKARSLIITLLDNGEQFVPEKGTVVMFRALKPDGKSVEYEATINEDGTITVELSEQALAVKGVVKADISLVGSDGSRLSTASFFLQNQEAPIGEDVGSESQILVFERLTSQAVEAANSASKDAEIAENARTEATEANENVQEIAKSLEQTVKDANTATSEALSAAEKANEAASSVENVPNDLMLTDRLLQLTANGEAVGDGVQLPQEKFELWNDITLEEDAVSVTMSQTQGGAPLNIKKLFVLFTGNSVNANPLIVLHFNGGNMYQMWQSVPWNDLETNFTLWAYSEKLAPGVFRSLYSKTPLKATNLDSLQGTSNANTEVGGCVARWANPNATYQKATKWTFGATSGIYTLKAGSRILVYGVQDTDS